MDNIKHELEIKERIGFVYDTIPYYGILTVNEMKSLIAPFTAIGTRISFSAISGSLT